MIVSPRCTSSGPSLTMFIETREKQVRGARLAESVHDICGDRTRAGSGHLVGDRVGALGGDRVGEVVDSSSPGENVSSKKFERLPNRESSTVTPSASRRRCCSP